MIDYNPQRMQVNANNGTVATITSDEYLFSLQTYLPDVELILEYYTKKLDDDIVRGISDALNMLEDYDTMLKVIKNNHPHWLDTCIKTTKEWTAWDNDRLFNKHRWFWQKDKVLGDEPEKTRISKICVQDKIDAIKSIVDSIYVHHTRGQTHHSHIVAEQIANNLVYTYFDHSTERAKEDAKRHVSFLNEAISNISAAKYSTIYIPNEAMNQLATIEEFIKTKLKEIED